MIREDQNVQPYVELVLAQAKDASILSNLLELYAHDFSEFHPLAIGNDGHFGYPALPLYWSEADWYPFLVKMDAGLAGLAFVKKGSEITGDTSAWDMAEFFILRGCRRRGAGVRAAHMIWQRLPGRWEVRVMQTNEAAQRFWARAVDDFTGGEIEPLSFVKSGERWLLFVFESA